MRLWRESPQKVIGDYELPVPFEHEELLPFPVSHRPFPNLGSWFHADWDIISWKNHNAAIDWWKNQEPID